MEEKMISAAKLKAALKSLPGKVFLQCGQLGHLLIRAEKDGFLVGIGYIDFNTGELRISRCPNCAVDLKVNDSGGKPRCPSCKNTYKEARL